MEPKRATIDEFKSKSVEWIQFCTVPLPPEGEDEIGPKDSISLVSLRSTTSMARKASASLMAQADKAALSAKAASMKERHGLAKEREERQKAEREIGLAVVKNRGLLPQLMARRHILRREDCYPLTWIHCSQWLTYLKKEYLLPYLCLCFRHPGTMEGCRVTTQVIGCTRKLKRQHKERRLHSLGRLSVQHGEVKLFHNLRRNLWSTQSELSSVQNTDN